MANLKKMGGNSHIENIFGGRGMSAIYLLCILNIKFLILHF